MLWFIAPPRSPHLLGVTPSNSVSEGLPFCARFRTDDSTMGISNSANEFLPTHVAKEASFVVIFPANRCQLLHGRFAVPFAKAPLRGKVNVDAVMKGSLHTDELMQAVVAPGIGLATARRMSHVFVMDAPTYPGPPFITDAALEVHPAP